MLNIERFELRDKRKEVIKTDNQLKSLQSVGQIIGEVLKEITTEKCIFSIMQIS
jgi:26S proteasome regulatory subunit T4